MLDTVYNGNTVKQLVKNRKPPSPIAGSKDIRQNMDILAHWENVIRGLGLL